MKYGDNIVKVYATSMAELEWYKILCKDKNIGYYDSFKEQDDKKGVRFNMARVKLETFWDDIAGQEERNKE